MSVEEISDGVIQMYTCLFTPDAVLLARVIHGVKLEVVVLQDLVEFGAVFEEHVVVSHPVVDEQRSLEICGVVEDR